MDVILISLLPSSIFIRVGHVLEIFERRAKDVMQIVLGFGGKTTRKKRKYMIIIIILREVVNRLPKTNIVLPILVAL